MITSATVTTITTTTMSNKTITTSKIIIATTTMTVIIIIHVIAFTHGIYSYIPETNHVFRVYMFAAVVYLHFVLHVKLVYL